MILFVDPGWASAGAVLLDGHIIVSRETLTIPARAYASGDHIHLLRRWGYDLCKEHYARPVVIERLGTRGVYRGRKLQSLELCAMGAGAIAAGASSTGAHVEFVPRTTWDGGRDNKRIRFEVETLIASGHIEDRSGATHAMTEHEIDALAMGWWWMARREIVNKEPTP